MEKAVVKHKVSLTERINIFRKIKNRLPHVPKRILILLIITLSIPITVGLALLQQEIRSRADYRPADYAKIRQAWINYKTGGNYDTSDPELQAYIDKKVKSIRMQALGTEDKLKKGEDRKYIFENVVKQDGGDGVAATYNRIELMALAYATEGALNDEEKERFYLEIKSALKWLNKNWYNEKTCLGDDGLLAYSGNQRDKSKCQESLLYQVDIPVALTSSIVLIYDRLSRDDDFESFKENNMKAVECFYPNPDNNNRNVNRFCKTPNGDENHDTGANLAMISVPLLLRAGISKNQPALEEVKKSYGKLLQYAEKGDGIYRDGSFIQHDKSPYNMWYGAIFLRQLTYLSILLNESGQGGGNNDRLYTFFVNSYQPFIFNTDPMDMVRGMFFKKPNTGNGQHDEIPLIDTELQIASFLKDDKYKYLGKDYVSKMSNVNEDSIDSIIKSYKLIKDPNLKTDNNYEITKLFPRMDRFVHVKKDFAYGISLSSKRIERYETVKSRNTNKRGWYMSDGVFYFYNKSDPGQYNDYYWAKIDMTKLPGTTVDNTIKLNKDNTYDGVHYDQAFAQTSPSNNNAGGTVLDNKYAVVGMELDSAFNVRAKKSYFIFDGEVVFLGSGIKGSNNKEVETIVENRKIKDDKSNIFLIDDASISGLENIKDPKWAYLEGTGGYYFPNGGDIFAQKEARRGSWNQISDANKNIELLPYKHFAQIIIKHGKSPTNGKYAYVFLPNKSQEGTVSYAGSPDIKIIENNTTAHVVKKNKLGITITSANFWDRGSAGGITASGPSSIIVDEEPDRINISVADPTQSQDRLNIKLNKNAGSVISKDSDSEISGISSTPEFTEFTVNTRNAKGSSFKISFAKDHDTSPSPGPLTELPFGYYDSATCTVSTGWACDADNYQKSLRVEFYADSPVGEGTFIGSKLAYLPREAGVGAECGGVTNHGFEFDTPESIKSGESRHIYAYAVDESGKKVILNNSPMTVKCEGTGKPAPREPKNCLPKITFLDTKKSAKKNQTVAYRIKINNSDKSCIDRKIAFQLKKPTTRWDFSPEIVQVKKGETKIVDFKVTSGPSAKSGVKKLDLTISGVYSEKVFNAQTLIYEVVQ